MPEFGLTEAGLNLPRAADIRERFKNEYELISGEEPDWSRDTFLGSLHVAVAEVAEDNASATQDVWDMLDRETATGVALDVHASLVGINRQKATFSTVELTVDGQTGVTVPAGSEVEDENGTRWELLDDVTLPGTVVAQADERGPIYAEIGEINNIVTPVTHWESVTNGVPPTVGNARQTDPELRQAIRRKLRGGVGSSPLGLRNELEQLPFITTALVIHNPTNDPQTVKGEDLPPHSYKAIVYPRNLSDDQQTRIIDTLYLVAPIGIESVGEEGEFIGEWPVFFEFPTISLGGLTLEIHVGPGFGFEEVSTNVEKEIIRYFNDLAVGQDARILNIYSAIAGVSGLEGIKDHIFYRNGLVESADRSIPVGATEILEADPPNITVVEA